MTTSEGWVRANAAYREVVRGWPQRAVLACSGGVDSSALLVLAGIAAQRGDIAPFTVAHVDHQTRPETGSEGGFVEGLADRYGLLTRRVIVEPADASTASSSPEDRLRQLRYAALARVAADLGDASVVTAHTRNDQIETVLMRLLSGSGGFALAGMSASAVVTTPAGTVKVRRPLLSVDRSELVAVLRRVGVVPIEDPSNDDRGYRRNAVRHDVIPRLQHAFPGFESALLRTTSLASRDADAVDAITREYAAGISLREERATRLDRAALRSAHPAVASRLIRWEASRLMPEDCRELTFERVESVRLALAGRTGAVIELPYRVVARVERDEIVFERRNYSVEGE